MDGMLWKQHLINNPNVCVYAAAKLSDVFGRKPILVGLTALFLVGSYGCAVAQTLSQMVIARAIAGFGAGGAVLMGNVVIHDLVPLAKRSRYQSIMQTVQTVIRYIANF